MGTCQAEPDYTTLMRGNARLALSRMVRQPEHELLNILKAKQQRKKSVIKSESDIAAPMLITDLFDVRTHAE